MNNHIDNLNLISQWITGKKESDTEVIHATQSILSDPDPVPRDILIGMSISHPDRVSLLLDDLPETGDHRLNLANLRIIIGRYNGHETHEMMKHAESLNDKGIPGTTLLEMLITEMDDDGRLPDSVLEGLSISASSLAEDAGVDAV